ncbi:MAG: metal-dependent hydrolase [Methanomicrobiales archaeon]
MRYYTHIAGGLLSFIIFAHIVDFNHTLLGLFFAGWISILPDLSEHITGRHRGLGHSLLWLIPLIIITFFYPVIGSALLIGFLSHLLLDLLTQHGCPLLYPWKDNDFVCLNKKRRIKTGSNQDKSVFIFITFLIVPLLIFHPALSPICDMMGITVASYATENNTNNTSLDIKNNININFQVDESNNKNITIERVNDTVTTVIIKELDPA